MRRGLGAADGGCRGWDLRQGRNFTVASEVYIRHPKKMEREGHFTFAAFFSKNSEPLSNHQTNIGHTQVEGYSTKSLI